MSYRTQRKLKKFNEQNGLCYWCEEPMFLILKDDPEHRNKPKCCTIDHVFNKLHPLRLAVEINSGPRNVAACYECNQIRAIEDHKYYRKNRNA